MRWFVSSCVLSLFTNISELLHSELPRGKSHPTLVSWAESAVLQLNDVHGWAPSGLQWLKHCAANLVSLPFHERGAGAKRWIGWNETKDTKWNLRLWTPSRMWGGRTEKPLSWKAGEEWIDTGSKTVSVWESSKMFYGKQAKHQRPSKWN